jgi:hypothetical protein
MALSQLWRRLKYDRGPPNTLWRVLSSRHVRDLRVIAIVAAGVLVLAILMYGVPDVFLFGGTAGSGPQAGTSPAAASIAASTADARSIIRLIASALATAAVTAISWAYQAANSRLGAVDVFGCEITAICRVSLVVDFAQSSVALPRSVAASDGGDWSSKFTSAENYTPAYDSQLSELQPLDINSVSSVTEFYTYRKTMMDFLRRLAATGDVAEKQKMAEQMIYMQFLMYESARYATDRLIEYQPNQAESLVIILCSEVALYAFLLQNVHDYRTKRLRLRLDDYREIVPALWKLLRANAAFQTWKKPCAIAQILADRYNELSAVLPADCDPLPPLEP